jgi:hypothetical protein
MTWGLSLEAMTAELFPDAYVRRCTHRGGYIVGRYVDDRELAEARTGRSLQVMVRVRDALTPKPRGRRRRLHWGKKH